MRIADFEKAMPKGIVMKQVKCCGGDVVYCIAHRDATVIVYDSMGKAFTFDRECWEKPKNISEGDFCALAGFALNIRLPEFDLKFNEA